jgi:diaminohydroxyphosphoribosylaminopyrimidine deaminase / 5-amino-6-(5-phosphoribosylamino)uracil reductase
LGDDGNRDDEYMREALDLARRGAGTTSPNPMVGAVVVSGNRVVGRGFHVRPGTPHAETLAIDQAGDAARGATLYVTLEPCAHWGRMPPCTDAIIRAGIGRVVAAMQDPDPRVRGRGLRRLAEAGVETSVGTAGEGARRLNEAYVKHRTTGLPFVTAKWAMSLDGRIATRAGESRWISGAASRAFVHEVRAASDAILVGIGTVLRDDPQLTARGVSPGSRQPARIVLDSTLRIPPDARVLNRDRVPVLVATTSRARPDARRALEARGVEVIVADGPGGRVDIGLVCNELGRRGMMSLLVEGGGVVHGAFVDARAVDRFLIFMAPLIVGGPAPSPVGGLGVERITDAWRLVDATVRWLDGDLLIEGYASGTARSEAAGGQAGAGRGEAGETACSPAS